jgi:uncharacterized protein
MKRIIESQLSAWKNHPSHKPLIVRGARQVGKTYSIKAFGKENFANTVVIDLEQRRDGHTVFAGDLDAIRVIHDLEIFTGERILPGQTLLFLDEIQACPRAIMSLRYLYEQLPELHVIVAGSLLEFALAENPFPVGRVEFLWMQPLCFDEYLEAMGKSILVESRPQVGAEQKSSAVAHAELSQQLRNYFVVGGMPEAVKTYAETGSFVEVQRIHQAIIESYLIDFAKYSHKVDRAVLTRILASLPERVGMQVKYASLYPEKRVETIKQCLQVLEQALMVHRVTASSAMGLPLGAQTNDKYFKFILLDIGLFRSLSGMGASLVLSDSQLLADFRGRSAEQFIGQELLASGGSENQKMYYWARIEKGSDAEVDYLWVKDGMIIPIEVKSGPSGKLKSLHQYFLAHPKADHGLVFHDGIAEMDRDNKILYQPLYGRF